MPIRLTTITESVSSSDKPNTHGTILLIRKNAGSSTVTADTWTVTSIHALDKCGDLGTWRENLNCRGICYLSALSNACFTAAFLSRNATNTKYRQLQGLAETIVGRGYCLLDSTQRCTHYKIYRCWICKTRSGLLYTLYCAKIKSS